MTRSILVILLFVVFIIAVIFLQIFLSKKGNKWTGMILPAITLFFSIIAALGFMLYMPTATLTEQSYKTILNTVQMPKLASLLEAFFIFILYNIPTVILLGVYYACRNRLKWNKEILKMNVQDLE